MQLTTEVREALSRVDAGGRCASVKDVGLLANEMIRLFPSHYFDEITPEGLVQAGFYHHEETNRLVHPVKGGMVWYEYRTSWMEPHFRVGGAYLVKETMPRNMGEVLELVQRCQEVPHEQAD